jgi:hypothetical protein
LLKTSSISLQMYKQPSLHNSSEKSNLLYP